MYADIQVRLYNYHRVFFPIQHNGYWMAIMLDTTAAKNLIFAPCGGFHVFPEHFAVVSWKGSGIPIAHTTGCRRYGAHHRQRGDELSAFLRNCL